MTSREAMAKAKELGFDQNKIDDADDENDMHVKLRDTLVPDAASTL
eukprot:COSAG05_NODE_1805_length_4045_cov_24.194015_3_plen_46_part_00